MTAEDSVSREPDLWRAAEDILRPDPSGALYRFRVLDLGQIVAGPHCAMLMADAGATVMKVEPPHGELGRLRGSVRTSGDDLASAYHLAVNRGKTSLTLDLKSPAGREVLERLVREADVLVENFRPGVMERLGFGPDAVRTMNPALIHVSVSLFKPAPAGEEAADRPGFAIIAEAESGIAAQSVDPVTGGPVWCGWPLGDYVAGVTAYGAVTTALLARARTGEGRRIEISMVDSLLSMMSTILASENIDGPAGPAMSAQAPYDYYAAADGYVAIAVNSDDRWRALCELMGREDLEVHPDYGHYKRRNQKPAEVRAAVEAWTRQVPRAALVGHLTNANIPCGSVRTTTEILADENLRGSGSLREVGDGLGNVDWLPANPMGFGESLGAVPVLDALRRHLNAKASSNGNA